MRKKMEDRPNLVIGAARSYKFEELRPFVNSLKRTSFRGDLVLLWNSLATETLDALKQSGVIPVHFSYYSFRAPGPWLNSLSRLWPWMAPVLRLPLGDAFRRVVYKRILNLAFVRFVHALDFLESNPGKYENVLLTDVRDVFFQDNPFRDPLPGRITAFLESPNMVFGSEPANDGWIWNQYGNEMIGRLRGHRISCCGTVVGTQEGISHYLRAYVSEIIHLKSVAHGADTSVHNVLVRDVLADQITIAENFQSIVGTINSSFTSNLVVGTDGLVVGPNGKLVPVLHQYDRLPDLMARLLRQLENPFVPDVKYSCGSN